MISSGVETAVNRSALIFGGGRVASELAHSLQMQGMRVCVVGGNSAFEPPIGDDETCSDTTGMPAALSHVGTALESFDIAVESVGNPQVVVMVVSDGVETAVAQDRESLAIWETTAERVILVPQAILRRAATAMVADGWDRLVVVCPLSGKGPYSAIRGRADTAAFAALIGMMKAIAKELATTGVTANCVAVLGLGEIAAGVTESSHSELPPAGRFAEPAEIADAAAYLISTEAGYVTGETINLDGALLME